MLELLQYGFMQHAIIAGLLASVACGIVGSYVVVKRIVFISGGISHCAYGGIGLGYLLGFNPIIGAVFFSIAAALGISMVDEKAGQHQDTIIGVMWATGMALGILFISLSPGYAPDLMSYLFGSIITVPLSDIFIMLALDLLIVLIVALLYKEFLALCFDEEFTAVVYPAYKILKMMLLLIIALSVVILIRVVGIILVIALLTIPAAISSMFTSSLNKMMLLSVILGAIFTTSGLYLSFVLDVASGATIILVSALAFLISMLFKKLLGKRFSSDLDKQVTVN